MTTTLTIKIHPQPIETAPKDGRIVSIYISCKSVFGDTGGHWTKAFWKLHKPSMFSRCIIGFWADRDGRPVLHESRFNYMSATHWADEIKIPAPK